MAVTGSVLPASLLALLVLAPGAYAAGSLTETVAMTRDFAHETARLLGGVSKQAPVGAESPAAQSLVALAPRPGIEERLSGPNPAAAVGLGIAGTISPPTMVPVPMVKPRGRWTIEEIDELIAAKAARYGLSPAFVRAVVSVESNYDVRARSRKGAIGLMQLMPETAARLGVDDPWDPEQNVEGGVRFLRELLLEFRDAGAALVAYNAGPGVVRGRQAIPAETRAYVRDVLERFSRFRER